jgi:hypothetical protein
VQAPFDGVSCPHRRQSDDFLVEAEAVTERKNAEEDLIDLGESIGQSAGRFLKSTRVDMSRSLAGAAAACVG